MRKQLLIIGLVVAVVLCIAAAGCTSTTQVQDQQQVLPTTTTTETTEVTPQTTITDPTLHIPIQSTPGATKEGNHKSLVGEKVVGDWVCYNEDGHSYLLSVSDDGKIIFYSEKSDTPLYTGYVNSRFAMDNSPYVVYYIDSSKNSDADIDIEYYEDDDAIYFEFKEDGAKYQTHLWMERMN